MEREEMEVAMKTHFEPWLNMYIIEYKTIDSTNTIDIIQCWLAGNEAIFKLSSISINLQKIMQKSW